MDSKLSQILAPILGIAVSELSLESNNINTANWDSLKQLNIVIAIEDEYGIELDEKAIESLTSVKNIISIIAASKNQNVA